jgi:MYXO-CTERM domain-containing protein
MTPKQALASVVSILLLFATARAAAEPLIIDGDDPSSTECPGGTLIDGGVACRYGGEHTFDWVDIRNGGRLEVEPFDGTDNVDTGNLVVKASGLDPTEEFSIRVDSASRITAKGAGYRARLCNDGEGSPLDPLSGGRGGCSVRDSGGGGGHFGRGGKSTKDCSSSGCVFPNQWEEACGHLDTTNTSCIEDTQDGQTCWGTSLDPPTAGDALPDVAGRFFRHPILDIEFGAAGGDKGCLDGDGFGGLRAGNGGGRIVLYAATSAQDGVVQIDGRISADGQRGCALENDSAGGSAGGTILIIGDTVRVEATARVSAHGGRGGDAQPKCLPCATDADCEPGQTCEAHLEPASGRPFSVCTPCNCTPCTTNDDCLYPGETCQDLGGSLTTVCADASGRCTPYDFGDDEGECLGTQNSGLCDDCGGGGGGGVINVQSRLSEISPEAIFDVRGGLGGICPICAGEAGGGAGELQLDSGYTGELCDGFDNDFDGVVDDGLGSLDCPDQSVPACANGSPQSCTLDRATCLVAAEDARPRFLLVLDSSGSMLLDPAGNPTFGDGSLEFPGVDTAADSDTLAGNDARLYIAKRAVARVLAAFPESDYALARYYQDVGVGRSCQTAANFECAGSCCSYDTPTDNVAPSYPDYYPRNECRLGALYPDAGYTFTEPGNLENLDIGWDSPKDNCINYAGSCGPPRRGAQVLAGFGSSLMRHLSWLDLHETDFSSDITPGAHCGDGDCELRATGPTPLAGALQAAADYLEPVVLCDGARDCRSYSVILLTDGVESCGGTPTEAAAALLGGVGGKPVTTYVIGFSVLDDERAELNALADAGGTDADDYRPVPSGDPAFFADNENDLANAIAQIVGSSQVFEVCNDADDDCDGLVDEDFPNKGLECDDGELGPCRGTGTYVCTDDATGTECVITDPGADPTDEVCNGIDDDCNGKIDDGIQCDCLAEEEVCDGRDNDCDGEIDETYPEEGKACKKPVAPNDEPPCKAGTWTCENGALHCTGAVEPREERCNGLDDNCDGVEDELAECPGSNQCTEGQCVMPCRQGEFPCPPGFECRAGGCFPLEGCDSDEDCGKGQRCVNTICVTAPAGAGGAGSSSPGGSEAGAAALHTGGEGEPAGAGPTTPREEGETGRCRHVSSTSGCACRATTEPEAATGWLALVWALAGAVVVRRRRDHGGHGHALEVSARGSLAVGALLLAVIVVTACGNSSDRSEDCVFVLSGAGGEGAGGEGASPSTGGMPSLNESDAGRTCAGADLKTDPNNCGECGNVCALPNAFAECDHGECLIDECVDGYFDEDPSKPGCETHCTDVDEPADAEYCDGLDNDCDGKVDEKADLLAPPGGTCTSTLDTPCEQVVIECDPGSGWVCHYPDAVELEESGGEWVVVEDESLCDGIDNDCDGLVDESFTELGEACDDGGVGACMDGGRIVCDAEDPSSTTCDLSVEPDPSPPSDEVCNGLDDDCNGLVDDGVVYDTVPLPNATSPEFFIDRWEASRPDATAEAAGVSSEIACTAQGVLPWTSVAYVQARAACAARGARYRLCTAEEMLAACSGTSDNLYPYGMTYEPETCNGLEYDSVRGGKNDDSLVPTGSLSGCRAEAGVMDLSGNASEWTSTDTTAAGDDEFIYQLFGGSYVSPSQGLACEMALVPRAAPETIQPTTGFRCCADP